MENLQDKAAFLKTEYTRQLAQLDPNTAPLWGKMNVQQMIEHMGDYVRIASGKDSLPFVTAEEHLPRMQAFLQSEKPFRENTPNPHMSDTPPAPKMTKQEAIDRLQQEIDDFFVIFENEKKGQTTLNPFFGNLDLDNNIQLLHKHAIHHLKQFGVE